MDAAPRLALLSFDFKISPEPAHFSQRLKQYISEVYHEDGESYRNELHQLEGLRTTAAHPTSDAAGRTVLVRYFCQLRALQSRFPMGKGQPAAVQFTWKDLYANVTASTDIKYEMSAVLYNIGAVHSHLGSSEVRTSSEGLKSACTHYQTAAWTFQQLLTQYATSAGKDISPQPARMLQALCLAQAQECILEKSIQDTRKPTVIGAVAMQVLAFYREAAVHLTSEHTSVSAFDIMGSKHGGHFQRYIQFKVAYVSCIAYLYHGMNAEEQQKMGERVAFYQLAVDKLNEARKLIKHIEPVEVTQEAITFTNDIVEGKRKAAKNENEFIYHEEVPEKELLTELKPVCLVKPIPINFNDPELCGTDLFARLVPIGAHEASSLYSEEKAKLLRRMVAAAEAKDQQLTEFMSSLQIDLLDATDADESIPQEVVDRCAAMNADSTIIQTLVDSMNTLAGTICDVEHALADVKEMIQEEANQEKQYQATMGTRPPSIVQTELSREANKYCEAHARTSESNQVLHKAMTLHLSNLRLLASPLEVLAEKIPSVAKIEGLDTATLGEMKRVIGAVRDMQRQRSDLLQQLREAINSDDITPQLLARSTESTDDIFRQELEKHEHRVKIIELNLAAQENIINRLTTVYAQYGESRRILADVVRRRDAFINALKTSYDTRSELLAKSQKGQEFYRKLFGNVNQLLARLRSTCQVQREERNTLLAKHTAKTTTPVPTRTSEPAAPAAPESTAPKLKDYLPYMKNRATRNTANTVKPDTLSSEQHMYPESMYPTSARPAPLGSEANTDPTQIYTDGYSRPNSTQNIYAPEYNYAENQHGGPILPGYQSYSKLASTYQQAEISFNPQAMDGNPNPNTYGTNFTPQQYPAQSANTPQHYYNPYYTGSQDANTNVTNSQNTSQFGADNVQPSSSTNPGVYYMQQGYNPQQMYPHSQQNLAASDILATSVSCYGNNVLSATSQSDLNTNFSQMHISENTTPAYQDATYSQTYFSAYYLQNNASNVATYSSAAQPTLTSMSSSQLQMDNSLKHPYSVTSNMPTTPLHPGSLQGVSGGIPVSYDTSSPALQYSQYGTTVPEITSQIYNTMNPAVSIAPSISEPAATLSYTQPNFNTNVANANVFPSDEKIISSAAMSALPVIDQPIKSHVTGQALASGSSLLEEMYQPNYPGTIDQNTTYAQPMEQIQLPNNIYPGLYPEQQPEINNTNYAQSYQSHPGYYYNSNTGNYEYTYGYQSSNPAINQSAENVQNHSPQNIYTSAGTHETVQSPSVNMEQPAFPLSDSDQNYYNSPYGYQTNTNARTNQVESSSETTSTNYGADNNQSTYMSSGNTRDSISTFSGQDRPTTSITPDSTEDSTDSGPSKTDSSKISISKIDTPNTGTPKIDTPKTGTPKIDNTKTEKSPEQSTMDLLSGLDFSVNQQPLMPEIKVPPASEHVIRKPPVQHTVDQLIQEEPKPDEPIERPAKRDLFSDPSLLNKFTQEVKVLQKLVDSLTNKMQSGITVLDNKWKVLHDAQTKENAGRSKSAAMEYCGSNVVSEVVPFNDSRLKLKVNPEVYINASYYKQLAPWCIPLVISCLPEEREHNAFWTAVLENKVACIVCLLSEMELQGKCYWPTGKGQSLELDNDLKVTLDEVDTTVHWTERRLTLAKRKSTHILVHYQINVFPTKVVSGPLLLLVDKILHATYTGRLSNQLSCAWLHCWTGAGRSALLALLTMLVCQTRAGQLSLSDMMDSGCLNLCKGRTNVLEDTKFLADAYRTALFYVQGVLCSGTANFNGEAVVVASSASVQPPPLTAAPKDKAPKFSKESFEEMRQTAGLKTGDMKDPLSFLDPLWSLKK